MIVFFALLGNANERSKALRKRKRSGSGSILNSLTAFPQRYLPHCDREHQHRPFLPSYNPAPAADSGRDTGCRRCFLGDVHEKGGLAVDGKVSRGSGRKETGEGPVKAMQMLNVYSCDTGICIGHKPIGEKTNEIPSAQEILELMELKGMIVTADAMNCQKETAAVIHDGKGEYVLALKGNQGLFYEEVKECLAVLRGKESSYKKTVEAEHGGTAVRKYYNFSLGISCPYFIRLSEPYFKKSPTFFS